MLIVFPFLAWIAAAMSGALLVALWMMGDLGRREAALLTGWFLAAVCCQFLGKTEGVITVGLALQTVLAIYLIARWRFTVG